MPEEKITRDMGVQPLVKILEQQGLSNHDLVAASTEQLTHKQVQKAGKGRRVSRNIQTKILNALQIARPDKEFVQGDIFTY